MTSHLHGLLPLSPHLSNTAQSAFVLNDLSNGTLISLAHLCDDNCLALFTKCDVTIHKNNQVIINGKHLSNGLWSLPIQPSPPLQPNGTLPIQPSPPLQANGMLCLDQTKSELAAFHHATLGSPVPSTLLRAIRRGHLVTFPGLTTNLISKHLPKSLATVLGHQDQEAKNLCSTKVLSLPISATASPATPIPELNSDLDNSLPLDTSSHTISPMLVSEQALFKSYSNQTGKFPVQSSRGNQCIFSSTIMTQT